MDDHYIHIPTTSGGRHKDLRVSPSHGPEPQLKVSSCNIAPLFKKPQQNRNAILFKVKESQIEPQ